MALSIYYQNVRGLKTKTSEFKNELLQTNYDIIFLTETWLNPNIYDSELFDDRYVVYRKDRSCVNYVQGGGVLIAVSTRLKSKLLIQPCNNFEAVWVTLLTNTSKLHLCCLYIPPTSKIDIYDIHFNNIFDTASCNPQDLLVILGDFNLPHTSWNLSQNDVILVNPQNDTERLLTNFMNLCNLNQYNLVKNSNNRLLDLALSNTNLQISASLHPLSKIDNHHPPLDIHLCLNHLKFLNLNPLTKLNYYRADFEGIIYTLSSINWKTELVDCNTNVNKSVCRFYRILNAAIIKYIPHYPNKTRKFPTWFSKPLIKAIKEKNKFHKKWKLYNNLQDYTAFSCLRKRVKFLFKTSYDTHVEYIENNISSDPKKFWRHVNSGKQSNCIPDSIYLDNKTASSGEDVCNIFAEFFQSVYVKPTTVNYIPHSVSNCPNNRSLSNIFISHEKIVQLLCEINTRSSPGPDGIHPVLIKSCAYYLSEPLFILFNASLRQGVFPDIWKHSYISPIFKSGDRHNAKNYRPISKLSCFAKIFEMAMMEVLNFHFKNIIIPEQHGFSKGKSTLTNLLTFTDYIYDSFHKHKQVDTINTDFAKAFDRVLHSILLNKLFNCGIHGSLLRWLESYITNRLLTVVVNGYNSNSFVPPSGVPQGSHIGPLLFLCYINDISSFIKFCKFLLFADDLKLYLCINSLEDCLHLQEDINNLLQYCHNNHLTLNINKCSVMSFYRILEPIRFTYKFYDEPLTFTTTVKDLGVLLDTKLRFDNHINTAINKAYRMLGFLIRQCKNFTNIKTLNILFNSLVRPHLEYCTPVWNPSYSKYIHSLEKVQIRFLRFLARKMNVPFETSQYYIFLKECNRMSLENRRIKFDVTTLFKIINYKIDPQLFIRKIKFSVPQKPCRKIQTFYIENCQTNYKLNSPLNRLMLSYDNYFSNTDIFHQALHNFIKTVTTLLLEKT